MPGISIQLDDAHVATINLAGMDVVNIHVHGALDTLPKASLHAMGGNYDEGGCGHLIWVGELSLQPGQVLRVTLAETCDAWDQGKTIEELFPNEELPRQTDFTISEDMAAEIRARPRIHESFAVQARTSQGQQAAAVSNEKNTDFSFGVLWDFTQPSQAHVSLGTHCLDDVLARQAGTNHLEAALSFGDSAVFTLDR
ncbi:MAG: hypothetical protein V4633_06455 [Pseudomonadota bacterium]